MMFLFSFVEGSKSVERGKNPLADMEPGGPISGPPTPLEDTFMWRFHLQQILLIQLPWLSVV